MCHFIFSSSCPYDGDDNAGSEGGTDADAARRDPTDCCDVWDIDQGIQQSGAARVCRKGVSHVSRCGHREE